MVPCLHQGNIYTKRKLRVWREQICIQQVGAIPHLPVRAVKIPRLEGGGIGPRTESCVNCDGPIAMVPCLHQGNIYTKRKLRVWRDQKCIPQVGAISTHLPVRAVKIPRLEGDGIGPGTESCVIWDGPIAMVPCLHQGNILYQKEATGMERPEMYSASRCKHHTYLCGPTKYPVSREAV